jgi:hypothetical protein
MTPAGLTIIIAAFIVISYAGDHSNEISHAQLAGRSSPDALDACLSDVTAREGRYDEASPAVQHCFDLWFKGNAFRVTAYSGGTFPCYNEETMTIKYDGAVTVVKNNTRKECVPEGGSSQQTTEFRLSPAELETIRAAVRRADVFRFKDHYADPNLVDDAGGWWVFVVNGKEKKIGMRVGTVKDLPGGLVDVITMVHQTLSKYKGE